MQHLQTQIIIILCALIPTIIWFLVFNKKHTIALSTGLFAFVLGWFSTYPVAYYGELWGIESNLVFFKIIPITDYKDNIVELFGFTSFTGALTELGGEFFALAFTALFFAFVGVGISEELVKHLVINPKARGPIRTLVYGIIFYYIIVNPDSTGSIIVLIIISILLYFLPKYIKFNSINDIVFISIMVALGFSFEENIYYFTNKWLQISSIIGATSIIGIPGYYLKIFIDFVFIRTTLATIVHIFCSGVFGYHYALAYYAKSEYGHRVKKGNSYPVLGYLSKLTKTPTYKLFSYKHIILALIFSTTLHGIYDILSKSNLDYNGFSLLIIAIPIYFLGGTVFLFKVLENSDNKRRIKVQAEEKD